MNLKDVLEEPKAYQMPKPEIESTTLGKVENLDLDLIRRLVFSVYDVRRDSLMFKNCFKDAKSFDAMRSNYRERRELSSLHLLNVEDKFKEQLSLLGFSVD